MNAPVRIQETKWDFPVAFSHWGEAEYAAMARVTASGRFTMGAEVEALEAEFAAYHGMKHAIAVNSGSSANLIAIAALFHLGMLQPGAQATVPALAWSTTYAPLIQHRVRITLDDCSHRDTWNTHDFPMLANDTALVIACPILGNPVDEVEVRRSAAKVGALLLVDCCESVGARLNGRLSGTAGIGNTFSFYFSHQMSAVEGGMILSNDANYAKTCRMLRSHGWTRGIIPHKDFGDEYCFNAFGYNVRPTELYAAIAREQLKKLDSRIAARAANFAYFADSASGLPIKLPVLTGEPSFFGIHFRVESREKRAQLAAALRAHSIDCRSPVGGSFRRQPYGLACINQSTPNADLIHDTGIMLGNPPCDGSHLIDKAVHVMKEVL